MEGEEEHSHNPEPRPQRVRVRRTRASPATAQVAEQPLSDQAPPSARRPIPTRSYDDERAPGMRRPPAAAPGLPSSFVTAFAASLCWTGALSLLLLGNLHREHDPLAPQRLLFYTLLLTAGILTFVPVQHTLAIPRLALEGVLSTTVLLYTLAFVPPPTHSLLALPDIPVYILFIAALFGSTATVVLPFIYAAGQRVFHQRARRLDVRRARRQAYEVGMFIACLAVLAALGSLTWVSLLLLFLVIVMAELLFLSRVEVQPR